jgi:hypothetical protein
MTALSWDKDGDRRFETGVSNGVLYIPDAGGAYVNGYVWNGLTAVTESPSGAEATPQYADNIKYLNLISAEQFGGTIEAFSSPPEFDQCDGSAELIAGVMIGQQDRKTFGFCYKTKIGTDQNSNAGYKIHMIYGAVAAPSERAYATVNESPEAMALSWEISTTPVAVPNHKPTANLVVDSTKVDATALAALELVLYGTVGQDPRLPLPDEVAAMFAGTITEVTPVAPTYNSTTKVITIPTVTGVVYKIGGITKTGTVTITTDTVVNAYPLASYKFPMVTDSDWFFDFDAA